MFRFFTYEERCKLITFFLLNKEPIVQVSDTRDDAMKYRSRIHKK